MPDFVTSLFGFSTIGAGEIVLRLTAAALLTMIIGFERELRSKPAGLRTHMLVGIGAAAFFIVAYEVFKSDLAHTEQARVDITRVIEGLIGGIGFLGAGAIIQSRGSVEGLTTAAGIWVSGAIGLTCGAGLYGIAILVSVFTYFVLVGLGYLERRFGDKLAKRDREASKSGDGDPR